MLAGMFAGRRFQFQLASAFCTLGSRRGLSDRVLYFLRAHLLEVTSVDNLLGEVKLMENGGSGRS